MRWVALLTLCLVCATARADDWEVKRNPFDPVVIRKYKSILVGSPHDRDALQRLINLYKAYSKVTKLEDEYRAEPESWSSLVVLARLPRTDKAQTIALWNRALVANPKDGRGWLALGDITVDGKAARAAFQHAVETATNNNEKKVALTKLIGAARSAADVKTVDGAYAALIELSPKDGQLWLDRGSAQLAASWFAVALESFSKAETLLVTDPERKLTAMMYVGVALDKLGRVDDALTQWEKTLDKTPKTSYIRREIVPRIVDAERKRKRLDEAIGRLEKRWPEPQRGHYEWDVLGDLYGEKGDAEKSLAMYKKAVAVASTEVETQRKLIKLLDKLYPAQALAQHEAAAKIAPGDANIQLDLARRYHEVEHDHQKALDVLARLAKRLGGNVGVRQSMAELYTQWEEPMRAIVEYEAMANLEPNDPDHAIILGDALWRTGQRPRAVEAWHRLTKINTATALLREGEILSLHDVWQDAAIAFTKSLALDSTSIEAWRGRARARDELGEYAAAVSDAKRAVALIGNATSDEGMRPRFQLVRALGRWNNQAELTKELRRWRYAFDHGDVGAGYLLVAHHSRIRSHQHHDTLVELYRKVPTDDALGFSVARSFMARKEFDNAKRELVAIGRRNPKKNEEVAHLIEQVEEDRQRAIEEAFRAEEGISSRAKDDADVIGRKHRFGIRMDLGVDVKGTHSSQVGFGIYRIKPLDNGTAFSTRFDYTQRDDHDEEVETFGIAGGFVKRVLATRRVDFSLGLGPRLEFRFDRAPMDSSWNAVGLAGEVTLEAVPRSLPATLGVRFQQAFTDPVRGSTMMVELGFEVR